MLHDVIRDAIIFKRSVTAWGDGLARRFSPHTLRRDAEGREIVIGYQYAGHRPGGLSPDGDWCCLRLSALENVLPNDDIWQRGAGKVPRYDLVSLEVWVS